MSSNEDGTRRRRRALMEARVSRLKRDTERTEDPDGRRAAAAAAEKCASLETAKRELAER